MRRTSWVLAGTSASACEKIVSTRVSRGGGAIASRCTSLLPTSSSRVG